MCLPCMISWCSACPALAKKFDQTVFGAVTAPGSNFDTLKACTAQSILTNAYGGLVAADTRTSPPMTAFLNGWVLAPGQGHPAERGGRQ